MHVETKGTGPDVVLIHGLGANKYTWLDAVEKLHPTYTTHAVDLIGFGDSVNQWTVSFRSTMKNQARQVISALDKKGITDFSLIGHSMGGGVSLYIANMVRTNRPDLTLRKMVLVAPVAYPPGAGLTGIDATSVGDIGDFVLGMLKLGYYDPTRIKIPDQVDAYAQNYKSLRGLPALGLHAAMLPKIANLAKHYPSIATPTKLVWGEDDKILNTASHAPTLQAALGNATLETIAKCGHNAVEECADQTTAIIKSFLDT